MKTLAIVLLALFLLAAPAGATSNSEVTSGLQQMSSAMGEVSSAASRGISAMPAVRTACTHLSTAATNFMMLSRPGKFNRTAWRHTQNAAMYAELAAESCLDGVDNFDPSSLHDATDYMQKVTSEVKLARSSL